MPSGLHVTMTVVGSPLRRSILPLAGDTLKAGCESGVKPQKKGSYVIATGRTLTWAGLGLEVRVGVMARVRVEVCAGIRVRVTPRTSLASP